MFRNGALDCLSLISLQVSPVNATSTVYWLVRVLGITAACSINTHHIHGVSTPADCGRGLVGGELSLFPALFSLSFGQFEERL